MAGGNNEFMLGLDLAFSQRM